MSVFLFLASIVSIGWGFRDWSVCTLETADALLQEWDPADESPLAQRALALKASNREMPEGQLGRIMIAGPSCREAHPWGEMAPNFAIFFLFLLAGIFARNQSQIIESIQLEERENARRASVPTPIGAGMTYDPEQFDANKQAVAIEISSDFDLGIGGEIDPEHEDAHKFREDEEESLMSFVSDKQTEQEAAELAEGVDDSDYRIGGFYCPRGYQGKPVVYVDAASEEATDAFGGDEPINNPERPFKTLEGAMKFAAARVVKDLPAVQVRLAPGVYQASVTIPDRVALVNHRLPAEGKPQRRLKWVAEQGLDHPDRVTILPPPNAKFALRFGSGKNQGVYGCHIVGREGVPQVGIMAKGSIKLTIFNCVIEGFTRGGVRLENAGAELPGHSTAIIGSRLLGNTAAKGGAVFADASSLSVRDCLIQQNKAVNGGAFYIQNSKGPIAVRMTRFSNNVALAKNLVEPDETTRLAAWKELEGAGGAIWCSGSKMKLVAAEFVDNKAQTVGGAVAIFNAKVVGHGDQDHDVRLHRNKARYGGGIIVAGWRNGDSTLKLEGADIQLNEALKGGGGIFVTGLSRVQILDAKIAHNKASEPRSCGGAIASSSGAEVILKDCELRENEATGSGGAICAVNSHLRILDECRIRDNSAEHYGGGVYFISEPNREIEDMVSMQSFKLPFVLETRECSIGSNKAGDLGAGLRVGNMDVRSTFPLGLKIERSTRILNNRTRHPDEAGDDVWIEWAGDTLATSKDRPGEKMLLK